jgi:hypothetical protein
MKIITLKHFYAYYLYVFQVIFLISFLCVFAFILSLFRLLGRGSGQPSNVDPDPKHCL